jgi:HAD superfamily hydrolase (TIGR01509 family)
MLPQMNTVASRTTRAVIFDLDGLLLDNESIYMEATRQVLARRRAELDTEVWWRLTGRPNLVVLRGIVDAAGLTVPAELLLTERQMVLDRHLTRAGALPGAERLVRELSSLGVPMAVATNSTAREYRAKAVRHDWLSLVDEVVTRDDVARGKPAPDPLLEAARQLNEPAERCIAIENAPSGIQAGQAAGMATVAVPTEGMDHRAFDGVDQLLTSLEEFRPSEWGLPAAS